MAAIKVTDLQKSYDGTAVVDGISFEVQRGEVFALLGPNGAGKSTTIEMIEGHRRRDGGTISVLGEDPEVSGARLRDRVGIVLQNSGIEDQLTVSEALRLYSSVYTRPRRVQDLLALMELEDQADDRVKTLSGGQRRRIDLALGIAGNPDVLFLDEPTTGFDAAARRRSWDLVESLRDSGTTILLTSHYMEEVERLADRVAVVLNGAIVAEGTPTSLISSFGGARVSFSLPDSHTIKDIPWTGVLSDDGAVVIFAQKPTAALCDLTMWAVREGIELHDLEVTRPSLEDAYLALAHDVELPSESTEDEHAAEVVA